MAQTVDLRKQAILEIVEAHAPISISQIQKHLRDDVSTPTLNRNLAAMVSQGLLTKIGEGRATAYQINPTRKFLESLDLKQYFATKYAERDITENFNYEFLAEVANASLFTQTELAELAALKRDYQKTIADISPTLHRKAFENLTIELSWKSSEIEGNTYSLLEAETLLVEGQTAAGKKHEEATMLLNHKQCLEYLLEQKDFAKTLNLPTMEHIHSLLIGGLGIKRNLRKRAVGITGTKYKPLDNEFQIKEAVEEMCAVINTKQNGFEKALLAVLMISYIQPFEDGNKRTARLTSNALLLADDMCPLSYGSVEVDDYKKATLLFYEQNNLSAFKEMFIQQVEYTVKRFFR